MVPGSFYDRQDVVHDRIIHPDRVYMLLQLRSSLRRRGRECVRLNRQVPSGCAKDFTFACRVRIADAQTQKEPVELRLGQRIGAVVLYRILRRDDHERPRHRM